jgi:hypothetical protein
VGAEELIKSWVDDSANHALVWANDWTIFAHGVRTKCEACGRAVSVWPIVAAKKASNPNLHIICKEKCMPLSLKIAGPLLFGGRISDNVLPKGLKDF